MDGCHFSRAVCMFVFASHLQMPCLSRRIPLRPCCANICSGALRCFRVSDSNVKFSGHAFDGNMFCSAEHPTSRPQTASANSSFFCTTISFFCTCVAVQKKLLAFPVKPARFPPLYNICYAALSALSSLSLPLGAEKVK